jgi:hypothetical protein
LEREEEAMSAPIPDPEVQLLAAVAATLKQDYIREGAVDPWVNSPFAWIRTLKSRQIGKIGEQLVSGWCAAKGFDVTRSPDSDADRIIGGRRMEIKFSTLWEAGGYTFQQIRNQNYEYAICLGISPFDAGCWVIPKDVLLERLPHQHGGAAGTDTRWLQFPASAPPDWLSDFGGTLGDAFEVLRIIAPLPDEPLP